MPDSDNSYWQEYDVRDRGWHPTASLDARSHSAYTTANLASILFGGANVSEGEPVSPFHSGFDALINHRVYDTPTAGEFKGVSRRQMSARAPNGNEYMTYKPFNRITFEARQVLGILRDSTTATDLFGKDAGRISSGVTRAGFDRHPYAATIIRHDVPGRTSTGKIGLNSDYVLHAHEINPTAVYVIDSSVIPALVAAQHVVRYGIDAVLEDRARRGQGDRDLYGDLENRPVWLPESTRSVKNTNDLMRYLFGHVIAGYDAHGAAGIVAQAYDVFEDRQCEFRAPLLDNIAKLVGSQRAVSPLAVDAEINPSRHTDAIAKTAVAYMQYHDIPLRAYAFSGPFDGKVTFIEHARNLSKNQLRENVQRGVGLITEAASDRYMALRNRTVDRLEMKRLAIWDPDVVLPRGCRRKFSQEDLGDLLDVNTRRQAQLERELFASEEPSEIDEQKGLQLCAIGADDDDCDVPF